MQKLARALNIEQGEGVLVSLILLQSFFIGTFMATFDVAANALFFTAFSGDDLGQAYAFSAVLGMAFTYVYIKLQSNIAFTKLAIFNLIFIALSCISIRLGFENSESKWLIYGAFLLQGPLNTLAIVGFWGLMGRIFNLRQGKRLFGLVDSGQILGMIIILFSVPLLKPIIPNTEDLIIISAIGISLSVVMQIVISNKYSTEILQQETSENSEGDGKSSGISIFQMIKNPYMAMMVLFVLLAMLAQFFAHYSFLVVSNQKYPTADEFASFLAVFMGVLMIFTFAFKTFVFGKLMEMYGLKVNLLILPFLLIFFTVLASVSGAIFGYTEESAGFQMFFLFIAISKLFAQSLRMAIEVPAFKLLYQPLDSGIRYDVQAKIDGTVNEFSALIGGLVLMGLSLISFITLIDYSFVLVAIIGFYIFIAFRLYSRYQDTLRETLNSFKSKIGMEDSNLNLQTIINNLFSKREADKTLSVMKLCEKVEPALFEESVRKAVSVNDESLNGFALNKIGNLGLSQLKSEVKKSNLSNSEEVLNKIDKKDITKDLKTIARYLRSKNPLDKVLLLNQVAEEKSNISVVAELLKDPNPKVKKVAIQTVGKLQEITLLPTVIDYIGNIQYRSVVTEVALSFGTPAFELLDLAFYKSNFDSQTLVQIVNVFSKSKNQEAIPFLLKKINYPDQQVVNATFEALMEFDFKANTSEAVKVQQSIEQEIGIALWNMVALEEAKEYELPEYMIRALKEETDDSVDHIYTLLSLIYDQQSVANIRSNIETGSAEGIGFAIELLDLFVAEELKPKLFPIFDDLDIDERIYRLELFYPVQRLEKQELLIQIINRDYNYINNWTKACAFYTLLQNIEGLEAKDDFVAHLFNNDTLLNQTAAWLVQMIDKQKYLEVLSRVDVESRTDLEDFIRNKSTNEDSLLFEKGLFMMSNNWLSVIRGKLLSKICGALNTVKLKSNQKLTEVVDGFPLAIVKQGEINFNGVEVKEGDIFSDLVLYDSSTVVASTDVELYTIENDKFYDLLYLHEDFLNIILDLIDNYHNQKVKTS